MLNLEQKLLRHPFLRGISTDNIKLLAEDAVPMVFQPGEKIFIQGRKADYFFLVESGIVEVGLFTHRSNGQDLVITRAVKGGNLGWSWAFAPYRWKFDARAKTRVEVIALEGKPVLAKMGRYPLLGYELMGHLAGSLAKGLEATRHALVRSLHRPETTELLVFPQPIV